MTSDAVDGTSPRVSRRLQGFKQVGRSLEPN